MVGKAGGERHIQRSEDISYALAMRRSKPDAFHSREYPLSMIL